MIIKNGTLREHALAWLVFIPIFAVFFAITWYMGRFVEAQWDINLLLFLNPDNYVPVLDELVILQTDFGMTYLLIISLVWIIGFYATRNRPGGKKWAQRTVHCIGILVALWHGAGMFVAKRGIFYWSEYEYPIIFLPLALIFLGGFYIAGNLYIWLDDENQEKFAQAFWLTLLSLFFVNVIGEDNIKELVARVRPLHKNNEAWNGAIRQMPDEIVRGGFSYVSGHTSSFWAQIFIYFMLIKSWKFRIPLLLLGAFHGYTRIYTTAHFPYCVLMATFFAIPVTAAIYYCFWNHRHLPLISMLLLSGALYQLKPKLTMPLTIAGIAIIWFLIYQYRHWKEPFVPLDNALVCKDRE
ncbi:MAG: phosphatase PAP2 family protein [Candidatus Hydrogenedentes bacterium]|jgi:membrane-associated phospholipid phosphatase|nr:phosphatase PAP2 family protein [Candidatus Hydrogenedentota bacterium]